MERAGGVRGAGGARPAANGLRGASRQGPGARISRVHTASWGPWGCCAVRRGSSHCGRGCPRTVWVQGVKGGGLGRLPGTCESARGGDCGLSVNHEVSEEFFSTVFYQNILIFLVPESPRLGNPAPPPSPRTSIFDPPVGGRNCTQLVH